MVKSSFKLNNNFYLCICMSVFALCCSVEDICFNLFNWFYFGFNITEFFFFKSTLSDIAF